MKPLAIVAAVGSVLGVLAILNAAFAVQRGDGEPLSILLVKGVFVAMFGTLLGGIGYGAWRHFGDA